MPPPRRNQALPWVIGVLVVSVLLCCCAIGGAVIYFTNIGYDQGDSALPGPAPSPAESAAPGIATAPANSATPAAPAPNGPVPKDVVYRGRGDKVVRLSLSPEYRHTATFSHRGGSNFIVWALDAAGDQSELVVNGVGRYAGVRPLDFRESPAALSVEADGAWTVTVRAFAKTPLWRGESAGTGPTVLRLDPASAGPRTLAVTHNGQENFVVIVHGEAWEDLRINHIGRYAGEVSLPPGASAISIQADGAWTIRAAS
jgi:hypothetical protein